MEQITTPMVYYRGGTSKAVFIDQRDLPVKDEKELAAWILAIYGSPDQRQIDGLGGADFLTSKFAVVGPPTRPDADVDYTFYQVSVTQPNVSKDMNCGNISSAVGPYAIDQGFVKADGDTTTIRVHATNFDDMIYVTVKTEDGKPKVLGTQYISGVPGTGSPITVDFRDTVGTHGKGLLPTGNLRDKIQVEGVGEFEVSIVDLANVLVFAKDFAAWILAAYRSPDTRQIDGLGGADPLTSKFAMVGPPTRPDADIDYTFYQVSIKTPIASRDSNCGNISSAIGPYAIEEGFVKATGETTTVRVHATNYNEIIYIKVQTEDGLPRFLGEQQISGVPGTGAPIVLDLHKLVDTHGKGLLPTGNASDSIEIEDLGRSSVRRRRPTSLAKGVGWKTSYA